MTRTLFIPWLVALWVTPALVAGMIGWRGIWGGGSAFSDLILPAPITGGIVHVPTFLLAIVIVRVCPKLPAAAVIVLRAGMLGAALIGLAHLVDLERVHLSLSTDLPLRGIPWRRDYFGLCLMTDALWTLPWLARWPRLAMRDAAALAIALLLPVAYIVLESKAMSEAAEPFLRGRSRNGPIDGDQGNFLYTRLSVEDAGFRAAARAAAERWLTPPASNAIVEDMAVYFTDSLAAARRFDMDRVLVTLCLYEDGTPERWFDGRGDCFSDHVTFSERFRTAFDSQPSGLPHDVQGYLAARPICADVVLPDERDQRLLAKYRCYDLDADLERLRLRYPNGEFDELIDAPP